MVPPIGVFFSPLKTFLVRLLTSFLVLASVSFAAEGMRFSDKEMKQGYRDSVVLAKPRASHRAMVDAAEAFEGMQVRQKFDRIGDLRVLELKVGETVPDAIARLRASGRYEYVETDRLIHKTITPNDPSFTTQWSLNNTGANGPGNGVVGADIHAVTAWDTLNSAPNVIVAVVDSGARLTHLDLVPNLWKNGSGFSGISATSGNGSITDNNPSDTDVGHGTHVSGIIGAAGNNSIGIVGVAWNVKLMELRFLHGTDGYGTTSDCVTCINYAITNGAKIINASFGSDQYSSSEFDAIKSAHDANVIFVASAGNDSLNVDIGTAYPAAYGLDNIVTVAATNNTDALDSYSNYGAGSVDLGAPGGNIYSCSYSGDNAYIAYSGTSMAAPHVSGALALLIAKYPSDTYRQTINRLLRSVTPLGSLSGKTQTGGRLNLAAALNQSDNRPFNDDFASRAVIVNSPNVQIRSNNLGATHESAEPVHGGTSGSASLWWSWTAPSSATVTFNTVGSSYDTKLAIYTGNALNALTQVAFNDDDTAHSLKTSVLTLNVTAGTTYQIAVESASSSTGLTLLSIGTVPPNDDIANAIVVTGSSLKVTGTNLNASRESGEPSPMSNRAGRSVWYRWVAPATGHYCLYAYSPNVDMLAAVYRGTNYANLSFVGVNDDAQPEITSGTYKGAVNSSSLVEFTATAGQTYSFYIDTTNVNPSGGDFTVTLSDTAYQFPAYGGIVSSPAVGANGVIYFGAGTTITDDALSSGSYPENNVYALNPNFTKKWSYTTGSPLDLSSPALGADGTVFIGSADKKLFALDGNTGALKWSYSTTGPVESAPAIATDGTIYVRDTPASGDSTLYALTNNGGSVTLKWTFAITGSTYASPSIADDGTVYVGGTGGAFYAVNPNGVQKWKFAANGDVYTTAAVATDGTVYFGTLTGYFYAVTGAGVQKWVWNIPSSSITSSPVLAPDGTIYFGGYDHKLHALSSSGTEKWAYTMADEVRAATPVVSATGTVYMPDYDGLVYAVSSSGVLVRTYPTAALIRSSPMIANGLLMFGSTDGLLYSYQLDASLDQAPASSAWPVFQHNARHDGQYSANIVTITASPYNQSATIASTVTLSVSATGPGALSYQWMKNGVAISGATSATYTLVNAQASDSGAYSVKITSTSGATATSAAATITVAAAVVSPGRLVNLSVRIGAGTGDSTLLVGFVVGGSGTAGTKPLLIRGVGPTLTAYGVGGALADPNLDFLLQGSTTPLFSNDNWGGDAQITSVGNAVGAFPFSSSTSKDSALYVTPGGGVYSARITGVSNTTGIALAEIYDASGGSFTSTTPRLINVSARALVGTGEGALIAGFVINGNSPRTVLIRGIGPTLGSYGVGGAIVDPQLELTQTVSGATVPVATNDNWNGDPMIASAASAVGAFALGSTSKDASILITLAPGVYSAKVTGVANTTGIGLIEVYEVP